MSSFFPLWKLCHSQLYVWFFDDQVIFSVLWIEVSFPRVPVTYWMFFWELNSSGTFHFHVSSPWKLSIVGFRIFELIDEAKNLESFTFVSRPPTDSICRKNNAFNLKNINICVHYLWEFSLFGCRRAQEATINVQQLNHVVEAYQAIILVWELLDEEWFSSDSTHFPRMMSFLKQFSGCRVINIYNQDVQGLIIPKNYRKMPSFHHCLNVALCRWGCRIHQRWRVETIWNWWTRCSGLHLLHVYRLGRSTLNNTETS